MKTLHVMSKMLFFVLILISGTHFSANAQNGTRSSVLLTNAAEEMQSYLDDSSSLYVRRVKMEGSTLHFSFQDTLTNISVLLKISADKVWMRRTSVNSWTGTFECVPESSMATFTLHKTYQTVERVQLICNKNQVNGFSDICLQCWKKASGRVNPTE
jgi:hypothetical protein